MAEKKNWILSVLQSYVPANLHQPDSQSGWIFRCMSVRPLKGHLEKWIFFLSTLLYIHAFWFYKKRSIRNTRWDFWKNKKQWLVQMESLRNTFLRQTSLEYLLRNMRSITSDNQNFASCKVYIFDIFLNCWVLITVC